MGHIHAANGLYLNIDEYGLFGELVLRKGNWKGRQLVSAAYVEEATRKHVDTPEPMPYGYGYQFWMTQIPGAVAASGNYGQGIIICPEKDAVISFMSLEGNYAPINENAPGILLEL